MATDEQHPRPVAGPGRTDGPGTTPLPQWERELRRMAVLQRREITTRRRPVRRRPLPLRVPGL